ncbi:hypothetical protein BDR26DRAFT_693840 [Obelidium mucronatum]|nr:hypothetical protein BDR26DRAFT_693840 [Obelidium mucronatum]
MDDDEVNEWHDAETVIRPASNDGVSAQSQTKAVDGLDSNALDPWAEEQRPDTISAQSTVISLETEVVPLVFAGESEILDCADAWGGSSEFPPVSSSQQDGSQIQAIDSSNSGLGPVLGEPANAQVFWKTISGKYVPAEAIPIGRDSDGAPLFAARALFKGGIHVGKARNGAVCHIPFGGKEILLSESDPYDVLCGNPGAVEWVPTNDKVSGSLVTTGRLIEGGREADGGLLFVGVCDTYFHGSQVGKCGPNLVGLHYSYGGKEIRVSHYRVALHCSPNEIDDLSFPGESSGERSGTIYWRAASVQHGVPAGAIRMGRDSDGAPLYAGRAKVVKEEFK